MIYGLKPQKPQKHALNQRSPAEGKGKGQKQHALKTQKFPEAARPEDPEVPRNSTPCFAPHALKGQKLLAQGNALGNYGRKPVAL